MKNSEFLDMLVVTGRIKKDDVDDLFHESKNKLDSTCLKLSSCYKDLRRLECEEYQILSMLSSFIDFDIDNEVLEVVKDYISFMFSMILNKSKREFVLDDIENICFVIKKDRKDYLKIMYHEDSYGDELVINDKVHLIDKESRLNKDKSKTINKVDLTGLDRKIIYHSILGIEQNTNNGEISIINKNKDNNINKERVKLENHKFKLLFNGTMEED